MSFSKFFVRGTIFLFIIVGVMAWFKKGKSGETAIPKKIEKIQRVPKRVIERTEKFLKVKQAEIVNTSKETAEKPEVKGEDRRPRPRTAIHRFFSRGSDKFDFIETIKYTSRVPWLKGRPAWIADYASYFATSRHFIARGLNKKEDYESQRVSSGDQFNVFKTDYHLEFQLVANLATCSMDFYCISGPDCKKEFIKSYSISVGRQDEHSASGYLTPLGKFSIGEKIAVYRPGVFNFFQNQKAEMIQIFGTRWLPFDKEIGECSDGAKGYGLHGLPCTTNELNELQEDLSLEGTASSDGCLRLKKSDIEEIFSIIITKATVIEIINDEEKKLEQEPLENIIVQNSDRHS